MAIWVTIEKAEPGSDGLPSRVYGRFFTSRHKGRPVVDGVGDMISPAELEKGAERFLRSCRKARTRHGKENNIFTGDLVESFVFDEAKAMALGVDWDGSVYWWGGFEVTDQKTRQRIADGELREFSIFGDAERAEVARPDDAWVDPRAPAKTFNVTDLDLTEVSFVPRGKGSGVSMQVLKEDTSMDNELIEQLRQAGATDAVLDIVRKAVSEKAQPDVGKEGDKPDKKPETPPVAKEGPGAAPASPPAPPVVVSPPAPVTPPAPAPSTEPVSKEAEDLKGQLAATQAQLAALEHQMRKTEKTAKVAKEYEALPLDAGHIAELELASNTVSKDGTQPAVVVMPRASAVAILDGLKKTNEALAQSQLMNPAGSSNTVPKFEGDGHTRLAKISKEAEEAAIAKGVDPTQAAIDAVRLAVAENPSLAAFV